MSNSHSGADWARKLTAFTEGIPKAGLTGAIKAAELVRGYVAVAAGRYATSSLTKTAVTPLPPTAALVRMTSRKAHLLDHDTRAVSRSGDDVILPGAITGVRGRKQALLIGSGNADGRPVSQSHKGATQGKHMWELGVAAAQPKIAEIMQNSVADSALKAFGL